MATVGRYLLERLRAWGCAASTANPGDGINGIMAGFHDVPELEFVQVLPAHVCVRDLRGEFLAVRSGEPAASARRQHARRLARPVADDPDRRRT